MILIKNTRKWSFTSKLTLTLTLNHFYMGRLWTYDLVNISLGVEIKILELQTAEISIFLNVIIFPGAILEKRLLRNFPGGAILAPCGILFRGVSRARITKIPPYVVRCEVQVDRPVPQPDYRYWLTSRTFGCEMTQLLAPVTLLSALVQLGRPDQSVSRPVLPR